MFDPVTAQMLRQAPELPDLDPATLPQTLTARYAQLIGRRLRSVDGGSFEEDSVWPLARIADAYELVASVHDDENSRRAAAFVAGTAHQILSHTAKGEGDVSSPILDRDRVDPSLAAALLFMAAEQYADANEAAQSIAIRERQQDFVATLLAENIRDFATGRVTKILERALRRPARFAARGDFEAMGTTALLEALLVGIELLAAETLNEPAPPYAVDRFDTARSAFARVRELSSNEYKSDDAAVGALLTTYPGPRHLAALLLSAAEATAGAAVTRIEPPSGASKEFWSRWLRHRAVTAPFMWRNHRDAIDKGFHLNGISAVMVLPTGAGKTTLSCFKIAAALARGKSIVFIAPTHALVEQLTVDLQEAFPEELLGSLVSSDFDRLFGADTSLRKIEVMTPEHCLALLSYAPAAFAEVGLMVFDECHLLSPTSGLRRALDGMFCVLAFNSLAPDADFLFLSAMIRNGVQFADWIGSLTGRSCVFVDPLWKPSRQARGVVFYEEKTVADIEGAARAAQRQEDVRTGKRAKGLRKGAKEQLLAKPFALFGLQHNWLKGKATDRAIVKIADTPVELGGALGRHRVLLKPNVNNVAARIAAACVQNNLKTIVFVNVKSHTVSTARTIARAIDKDPQATHDEQERWKALEAELGGLQHSLLDGPASAVPHNAQMLRLERDLAERMFRRPDGAKVIVATPTLAQGLNLPAHFAILASDMRADPEDGGREALAAHEILNAAARAGRAGHLANGVVLLIPEEILTFAKGKPLASNALRKLHSILPEDDRCVDMSDPLQVVLDRIGTAATDDLDVEYALNRLSTTVAPEGAETAASTRFAMDKSFAAFLAAQRKASKTFDAQIVKLNRLLGERNTSSPDAALLELAAQSGAPVAVLGGLRDRLVAGIDELPDTILGWLGWVFKWLEEDEQARSSLLDRDRRVLLAAVGRRADGSLSADVVNELLPGVSAWLNGNPLSAIEAALMGDAKAQPECPRARHLVTQLIPLTLTFISGLVAKTAQEISDVAIGLATPRSVIDSFTAAVRKGYDTPSKLAFAELKKGLFSRVQFHQAYATELGKELPVSRVDDYSAVVGKMRVRLADS